MFAKALFNQYVCVLMPILNFGRYELMRRCWDEEPGLRPSVDEILTELKEM